MFLSLLLSLFVQWLWVVLLKGGLYIRRLRWPSWQQAAIDGNCSCQNILISDLGCDKVRNKGICFFHLKNKENSKHILNPSLGPNMTLQ